MPTSSGAALAAQLPRPARGLPGHLLTDVHRWTGVPLGTLRGWCRTGGILSEGSVKDGDGYRVTHEAVQQLLRHPPVRSRGHVEAAAALTLAVDAPAPPPTENSDSEHKAARLLARLDGAHARIARLEAEVARWRAAAQRADIAMQQYRENWHDFARNDETAPEVDRPAIPGK